MAGGGGIAVRNKFFADFSAAFAAGAIANTLAQLQPFDPTWDHLDILYRLNLLPWVQPGQLPAYRQTLTIPALNQAIITQVMRYCLLNQPAPMPLQVCVVAAPVEAVKASVGSDRIYLDIGRTSYT